jgi:hypothetical protein
MNATGLPATNVDCVETPGWAAMARMTPWVVSLLFHVGVFLVMLFLIMIVWNPTSPVEIVVPLGVHDDSPTSFNTPANTPSTKRPTPTTARRPTHQPVRANAGQTDKLLNVMGPAGASAGGAQMGMASVGGGGGGGTWFSHTTRADNIVYVIDRSGSMTDTFETVKLEMLRSIGRLSEKHSYHIVLFAEGQPMEDRSRKLKRATRENKVLAYDFLNDIIAEGQTNPIPALKRAFGVLSGARGKKSLIVLLTDGAFDDSSQVLATIDQLNAGRTVRVNTFLYGHRPPEAVETMKKIAQSHNGKYRFVQDGP